MESNVVYRVNVLKILSFVSELWREKKEFKCRLYQEMLEAHWFEPCVGHIFFYNYLLLFC